MATAPQWWQDKARQLVQMNLRDIDVDFDPDDYLRLIKQFRAEHYTPPSRGIKGERVPATYRSPVTLVAESEPMGRRRSTIP